MPLQFGRTAETSADEIRALIEEAFHLQDGDPVLDPRTLHWKYWQPRDDWQGSRSYELRQGDTLLAHAAVLPVTLEDECRTVRGQHFIDWASSSKSVSGGVQLLRKLTGLADVTFAIGGSASTRRVLPMFGFRQIGTVLRMGRPVRPSLQARTHQSRNWKLPLRLARNALWNWRHPAAAPIGWAYERVEPEAVAVELWKAPADEGTLQRQRSAGATHYFLTCPAVRFEFFLARENGIAQGGFLIGYAGGQARIVDLWVQAPSIEQYAPCYQLACAACCADSRVAEIVTWASVDKRKRALERCGFRVLDERPFMAFAASQALPGAVDCQMLDNDAAFLSGRYRYLT
jgi:hypothetical protein